MPIPTPPADERAILREFFRRPEKSVGRSLGWAQFVMGALSREAGAVLDAPLLVGLNLVNRCNQRCCYCSRLDDFTPSAGAPGVGAPSAGAGPSLEWPDYRRLVDHMAEARVMEVYLTGGEPLLRRDLVLRLVRRLADTPIAFKVLSNGTLLWPAVVDALAPHMPAGRSALQVSLDAADRRAYRQMTGTDLFDRVLANLRHARGAGISTRINMVVTDRNVSQMAEMLTLAAELEVEAISFSPVFLCRGGPVGQPPVSRVESEWCRALGVLEALGERAPRIHKHPFPVSCGLDLFEHGGEPPVFECPMAVTACEVTPQGDVVPCPYLDGERWTAGNVRDEPLDVIWRRGRRWQPLRARHFDPASALGDSRCGTCRHAARCAGACMAQAYELTGSFSIGDPRCPRYAADDLLPTPSNGVTAP